MRGGLSARTSSPSLRALPSTAVNHVPYRSPHCHEARDKEGESEAYKGWASRGRPDSTSLPSGVAAARAYWLQGSGSIAPAGPPLPYAAAATASTCSCPRIPVRASWSSMNVCAHVCAGRARVHATRPCHRAMQARVRSFPPGTTRRGAGAQAAPADPASALRTAATPAPPAPPRAVLYYMGVLRAALRQEGRFQGRESDEPPHHRMLFRDG